MHVEAATGDDEPDTDELEAAGNDAVVPHPASSSPADTAATAVRVMRAGRITGPLPLAEVHPAHPV